MIALTRFVVPSGDIASSPRNDDVTQPPHAAEASTSTTSAPRSKTERTVRAKRPTRGAARLRGAVRRVAHLPAMQTAPMPQRHATIALERVALIAARPAARLAALALVAACAAHVAFGGWSLSLRPARASTERIAMAVAKEPEMLPADEVEVPAPPPPPKSRAATQTATADVPAAAGPVIPGLTPSSLATGQGGDGNGVNVGSSSSSVAAPREAQASAEPRVEPPRVRSRSAPEYPRRAREQGIEGRVTLQLLVDASGNVREARVLTSEPPGVFDAAARAAALRFTFAPGTVDGKPADAWVRQAIRFELD